MKDQNILEQIQILMNQLKVKNFQHVLTKGKVLLKKNPEYVILYNLVGSSYQNLGENINAEIYFKKGLKLDANNIALMNNLAMTYKNLLKYKLSEEIYKKIINLNNKYINAYVNLGNLKRDLNQFDEAIKFYEKALLINDTNPIIYYSLALAHQGVGNFEKTSFYSRKALEYDPNFTRADHLISQSINYKKNDKHYKDMRQKLINFKSKSLERVDLCFSLAKAEEDIGNIEAASEYLIEGNKTKKSLIDYEVNSEINLINDIIRKFSLIKNEKILKENNNNIIFILGMPRSGTSLIEQIITSHSKVFGCGELPILSNIIKKKFIKNNDSIIDNLDESIKDPMFITPLRKEYFDFIDNFNHNQKKITDKAPLNFRWIGFIRILFPKAKIIHCVREPKNNCLSMFKNLFEGGLNFTYDQEDLVKFYNHYVKLMNFWKSKYSLDIMDINYEDLISNSQATIKEIIKFCNLEWEENCLEFYKNKTPIKTMSTAQARKPLYKTSLKNFEKYKNYLKILEESL